MALLADAILLLHFAIAAYIAAGLLLIPLGARRRWPWTSRRDLRLLHLVLVIVVAMESVVGLACPLTVVEDLLRGSAGSHPGFVQRWVGALLYWNLPGWFFTSLYAAIAALTTIYWRAFPPADKAA